MFIAGNYFFILAWRGFERYLDKRRRGLLELKHRENMEKILKQKSALCKFLS
jgi:hypothetical protein